MRVEWQPSAVDQLEAIYEYVASEQRAAARHLVKTILDITDQLAEFPKLGRVTHSGGLRLLTIEKYVVTYRIKEYTIQILAVTHGARRRRLT